MTMVTGLTLPRWMRRTLLVTAALNAFGACMMAPPTGGALRLLAGLPEGEPLYMWIVAAFVLIFSAAYLAAGLAGRADTLFIAVGAAGKIAFSVLLGVYWIIPWIRWPRTVSVRSSSRSGPSSAPLPMAISPARRS